MKYKGPQPVQMTTSGKTFEYAPRTVLKSMIYLHGQQQQKNPLQYKACVEKYFILSPLGHWSKMVLDYLYYLLKA
jgi:hypothetical protein